MGQSLRDHKDLVQSNRAMFGVKLHVLGAVSACTAVVLAWARRLLAQHHPHHGGAPFLVILVAIAVVLHTKP